jgi:hypothetical protein
MFDYFSFQINFFLDVYKYVLYIRTLTINLWVQIV